MDSSSNKPSNPYDDASTLEKADMHISDARGFSVGATANLKAAAQDLGTAIGLSSNNLAKRLNPEQLIAVAQVKATIGLIVAMQSVAHATIANYLMLKGHSDLEPRQEWDLSQLEKPDGNQGTEEVSEEPTEATQE